ncbi:MAG TPA: HAMP domain-containing sensor histidine kinase [Terrabacter sp.]|nr:HAMP domain-containing sensor histidine kinase [Terrabacter sp.]
MSSSRPSDHAELTHPNPPGDRPDPADLPDVDDATEPDVFARGVGFSDASGSSSDSGSARDSGSASDSGSLGESDRPTIQERLAEVRGRIRPWSAWTLRAKLVASMLALFTVLSLATSAFTVVALDRQLMSQVDDQLRTSVSQLVNGRPFDTGLGDRDGGGPRGPGDEGLIAFFPTSPTADVPAPAGTASAGGHDRTPLSSTQLTDLSAAGVGMEPTTVKLGGLGPYRLVSSTGSLVNPQTRTVTSGTFVVGLPIEQQQHTVQRMVFLAISTLLGGILLVAVLGTWLVRRNLEPLRRVAATATKVSQTPLASGSVAIAERVDPVDTDRRTEVGQVGAAFNDMLDHVDEALNARHRSEQRVRQFVADASHELRTPLASIKGYAELSRREPNAVPPTVTHAMGRIESEANRMGSLVEDLLLLARLDAGRPLEEAPVDMSMLVINAVSDAHAASPGHHWDLDLPPEPVEVRGDSARLHQVVTNLLANARTHTPDGTRVTTSVRPEGEWVRVAVHDDGPGVPESLQPNVFERFARGDDARNRAKGSTGLGLSIVAAVSKAHGGRVELDSRPGDTTFSLLLPAAS